MGTRVVGEASVSCVVGLGFSVLLGLMTGLGWHSKRVWVSMQQKIQIPLVLVLVLVVIILIMLIVVVTIAIVLIVIVAIIVAVAIVTILIIMNYYCSRCRV